MALVDASSYMMEVVRVVQLCAVTSELDTEEAERVRVLTASECWLLVVAAVVGGIEAGELGAAMRFLGAGVSPWGVGCDIVGGESKERVWGTKCAELIYLKLRESVLFRNV
jgi:hypothetical protein